MELAAPFEVIVPEQQKSKRALKYLVRESANPMGSRQVLFTKMGIVPFEFNIPLEYYNAPGACLAISARYEDSVLKEKYVEMCPVHQKEEDTKPVAPGQRLFMQISDDGYHPAMLAAEGNHFNAIAISPTNSLNLKFACFSSCSSINRRPLILIFDLTGDGLPRQTFQMGLRVCASPKRDADMDASSSTNEKVNNLLLNFANELEKAGPIERQVEAIKKRLHLYFPEQYSNEGGLRVQKLLAKMKSTGLTKLHVDVLWAVLGRKEANCSDANCQKWAPSLLRWLDKEVLKAATEVHLESYIKIFDDAKVEGRKALAESARQICQATFCQLEILPFPAPFIAVGFICEAHRLNMEAGVFTTSSNAPNSPTVPQIWDALEELCDNDQQLKEIRDYKKRLQSEQPGYPLMCNFEPMLLARLDIADWYKKIDDHAGSNFLMELKFDGEHVVIHKNFDDWRVVTRNGKDFTKYYNGDEGNKNLIEAVRPYFRNDANEFVIDCELMLYDEVGKCFVRHHQVCADGQTYNFQHIKPADPVHLAVVVLDVLYLNGNNFMGTSFDKRIEVLEKLLLKKQDPTLIFIPERKTGNTKEDVRAYFKQSMENGDEGIVVKAVSTLYTPGKRLATNGWFKVNLTEGAHLDVAIVGVKYVGTAREQELVIAVKQRSFSEMSKEYAEPANDATFDLKVIGSVGAGLTQDERRWVLDEGRRTGALLSDPPAGVQGAPIKDGGYFRDWDDFKVVEVRCAGKQNGALHHAGLVRLCNDKDLKDLDTYRDFKELDERIRSGGLPELDQEAAASRKRPAKQPQISRAKLAREGVKQDAKAEKIDDGLEGQFVCVIPGRSDKKLAELVEILKGFGATVQALPDDQTKFLVAVDRNVPQTNKRVKEARWTIVAEAWLRRCKERGEIVEWTPEETLYDVASTTSD